MKSIISILLAVSFIISINAKIQDSNLFSKNGYDFIQKKKKKKSKNQNVTTYFYFSDKKLSVKIAPKSEKQKIWIYNSKGEIIYELENVSLSYTISNDLKFRENGSLESVTTHLNPGASLYMYTTFIAFDENNEPLYKIEEKHPSTLEELLHNKWLWQKDKKQWIKQEIIIETNSPIKQN